MEVPARVSATAAAGAASLVEASVDVAELLTSADGAEVSALAVQRWSADLSASPSLRGWLQQRREDDAEVARVLDAAASGSLHLRVDVDAAVVRLARCRRGALVHVLLATRWAERVPSRPGVATRAARLGMGVVPRARTTAWRALAAVRADAADLVTRARAAGARTSDADLLAEVARCVFAFGDGTPLVSPERAVGYLSAGVSAEEAWAHEALPEGQRPTPGALDLLAALTGTRR